MPMTDALAYLHGTGTQAGSLTSTANVAGSGSQAGTILTITTVTSGQFGVGQYISGTGLPAGEYITALGSGSGTAGTYAVSLSSTTAAAFTTVTATPNTLGDAIGTASGYTNLVTVTTQARSGRKVIAGTVFDGVPRIVRLRDLHVEFVPEGHILVLAYEDRPGMVGRIGSILGRHNVNIASMHVGRRTRRGRAIVVLLLDDDVPAEVLEEVGKSVEADFARVIRL